MGFQIAYVIELVDRYSKVADDFMKKMKHVDMSVLNSTKRFAKFDKTGVQAFRRTARSSKIAAKRINELAAGTANL